MLSQLSNIKGFGNDLNGNVMNSNMTNNNANPLFQMFQYLQSQGGNMNGLLHSITNNNTAFQNNRMNNSYSNMDYKGKSI
jgi:enoyl-[acyl-carrier-protein] reductase (NADH)